MTYDGEECDPVGPPRTRNPTNYTALPRPVDFDEEMDDFGQKKKKENTGFRGTRLT
jgi:hypothetical protein